MVEEKKVETSSVRVGDLAECVVEQIMPYGAFVRLSTGQRGMVHISELSFNFVKKVEDILTLQQNIKARVIKIDEKGRIDLSLKKVEERPLVQAPITKEDKDSFEKKMASFLKVSEAKIADLNSKMNSPKSGKKKAGSGKPKS
ncbi:MAG: S1 RNA-binding domain-containing protein [Synergistaceae bacterium]|jgi:S1 RNA binding domain protein|nr:S1 RNA-binding domain-containing protein [Synergistaceae bacterium]